MSSDETLTRADIAELLNKQVGLSRAESAELVEQVLDLVTDALTAGQNVKISGFGTFVLRDKNERVGRNPEDRDRSADHATARADLPAKPVVAGAKSPGN